MGTKRLNWASHPEVDCASKSYHSKPGYCRTAAEKSQGWKHFLRVEVHNLYTNRRNEVKRFRSAVNREIWKVDRDIADRNDGLDQDSYEDDRDSKDRRAKVRTDFKAEVEDDEVFLRNG